jgi:hypothetical protein
MKKKYWLIIALIIIGLILVIIFYKKKEMNKFTFPITLSVRNYTQYKALDTISMVILNRELGIDTMDINLYYIVNNNISTDKIEIAAFIQKNPFEKHKYNIFINKDLNGLNLTYGKLLSHELLHLYQMEKNELIQFTDHVIYRGDTIYFSTVKYDDRPYEKAAYKGQDSIEKKLNKLLYSK